MSSSRSLMAGSPKVGGFHLALRFQDGRRVPSERSFESFRDALEWCGGTKVWELFEDLEWVIVDSSDQRTVGEVREVLDQFSFVGIDGEIDDEDWEDWLADEEEELEDLKEIAEQEESSMAKPRCSCGGIVIGASWHRHKAQALVGSCDSCARTHVLQLKDEGPRML